MSGLKNVLQICEEKITMEQTIEIIKDIRPVVHKFYKIRRKSDGLFSDDRNPGCFSNVGAHWNNINSLDNYLRSKCGKYHLNGWIEVPWSDLEIVVFEGIVSETETQEASKFLDEMEIRYKKLRLEAEYQKVKTQLKKAQQSYADTKKAIDDFRTKYES